MATIAFADVLNYTPLPIDAQDVASKIRLVIAGNRAGPEPSTFINFEATGEFPLVDQAVAYAARPLIYRHVNDNDTDAERSVPLGEGVSPFLPPEHADVPEPTSVTGFTNAGDPSAVRDGDLTTYASTSGGGTISYSNVAKAVGFRLVYTSAEAGQVGIILNPGVAPITTWAIYDLGAASAPAEMEALVLLDARTAWENKTPQLVPIPTSPPSSVLDGAPTRTQMSITFASGAAQVFEFYPLIPDETLLESIAKANLKLPASAPQRVSVRGYQPADRTHTITGWPGGDFTGAVAQVQYEVDRTIIDFEQAGSPVGLPAEAIEAARAQKVATQSVVDTAGYGLKMGERQ